MSWGTKLEEWSKPPTGPESSVRYTLRRVARHVHWARTEGLGRLIEEDRLDPRARIRLAVDKARWRASNHRQPGQARPVYVVGLQRSGTNMLMRGFDEAPEVEVRNENDRTLFERFTLRGDDVVVRTVAASRHELVLIKPLCETHRVADLLDLPGTRAGAALWVYRHPVDRARSEVSKFGSSNLAALKTIAEGRGDTIWQGQRVSAESLELIRRFDLSAMSPHTAAVLFWVVRNRLFFELGLDRRPDVVLVSYDAFAAEPEPVMRRVCRALDFPFRPQLCAHVEPRQSHGSSSLHIDQAVLDEALALLARLDDARRHQEQA